MREIIEDIANKLQWLQENCLGTCKIAGDHSFIIEHDLVTGYTVTFQVRESGGTSVDHFTYKEWNPAMTVSENLLNQQGQPPITEWELY